MVAPESAPDVPATGEDLTASWLDAALRASGVIDATVTDVLVEAGPTGGLMGEMFRIIPTYGSGTGPDTMIVKLPATTVGGREVGIMLGAWARECAFYEHVAPHSPGARVPDCFHAAGDPENEQWVVVIEECRADPVDATSGVSTNQAVAAVEALAAFHAAWWDSPQRFDWMPGFDSGGVGSLQPLWLDSIPIFLERYGHVIPSPSNEWILEFAPQLSDWSRRAATEPITIVHADYRSDNVLFDGDQVTMIDWQTALRGPAAMDLTSFIATSLSIESRRAIEPMLIDRYLAVLEESGVLVDRAWFDRSYDENILWWMGQFANNLARLYPDDVAIQTRLDIMVERTYQLGLDRDVGRLLRD